MQNIVQLSTDQLQSLIDTIRAATIAGDANANTPTTLQTKGSFANCSSRFRGQRDHDAVEEFITSIVTYKEIETISDEDALKGLSLLLVGTASTWWLGVRREAKTWADAIALIKENFAPTKPAYLIYLELFSRKQEDRTAIDTFVCQKRALLAQLPEGRHNEETELDLVYGLLNIKYRKVIQRHDIKSFRELLEKGRILEHNSLEYETWKTAFVSDTMRRKRCSFCNSRGHNYDECRKRKSENEHKNKEPKEGKNEAVE